MNVLFSNSLILKAFLYLCNISSESLFQNLIKLFFHRSVKEENIFSKNTLIRSNVKGSYCVMLEKHYKNTRTDGSGKHYLNGRLSLTER